MRKMRLRGWQCIVLLLIGSIWGLIARSTSAQTPVPTSTPDAEGVIYEVVQPNDSLWGISDRVGIPFAELLALNDLTEDSIIQPGQRLIVGQGTPPATATSTLAPVTPTATFPPPSTLLPTPPPETAVCLTAFDDLNRNGQHDGGEPLKVGVAFTLYNESEVVGNYVTDGSTAVHCFRDLSAGSYVITRSIAEGEILTTAGERAILVAVGRVVNLAFGSYRPTVTPPPATLAADAAPLLQADAGELATVVVNDARAATPPATSSSDRTMARIWLFLGGGLLSFGILLLLGIILLILWKRRLQT